MLKSAIKAFLGFHHKTEAKRLPPNTTSAIPARILLVGCLAAACAPNAMTGLSGGSSELRVYWNPYGDVDWDADLRLLTQMHDHVASGSAFMRAYDQAGYHVVSLMDYSGVPTLPYSRTERLWPPDRVLSDSLRARLQNIQVFLPNAEEVGFEHVTSPFMVGYIEKWEPAAGRQRRPHHYGSTQEAIDLIRRGGGLPFVAHPWGRRDAYEHFQNFHGIEVYSAYAAVQQRDGESWQIGGHADPNGALIQLWDQLLTENRYVLGIAVNDHYGPAGPLQPGDTLRDSGKIIVIAESATLPVVRTAIESGTFFAVRDFGQEKGNYPRIDSIVSTSEHLEIRATGEVTWISGGRTIGTGPTIPIEVVGSGYVRAEVRDSEGSVVYVQPIVVKPRGDIDGDGDVDALDWALCRALPARGPMTWADACDAIEAS